MRIKSEYQKALKKYSVVKILKMYRDKQITLNEKEWKDLHKKINKKILLNFNNNKQVSYKSILIGFGIIIIISILSVGDFVDQTKKCNKIKEHICTKYEIEKLND